MVKKWLVTSFLHSIYLSTAFDVTPLIALRKGFIALGLYHHTGSVNQCSKESQARSGGDAKEGIISKISSRLHPTVHLLHYYTLPVFSSISLFLVGSIRPLPHRCHTPKVSIYFLAAALKCTPLFPFSYKLSFLFPVGLINSNMQGTPRDPFLINSREFLSIIYTSSYHVAQSFHILLGSSSPA